MDRGRGHEKTTPTPTGDSFTANASRMKKQEAINLGQQIRRRLQENQREEAFRLLLPVLSSRIPFPRLEDIGRTMALPRYADILPFLDLIAATCSEGGWVIIASALQGYLSEELEPVFSRTRRYIVLADAWYACDIFGERIPGPALLTRFVPSLHLLEAWREDTNPWIRRTVGVAVHFWAKRTHGQANFVPQAQALLQFLEPLFAERDTKALKGIGWGLKTMGRYYPEITSRWLEEQTRHGSRKPSALMLRKATAYLPPHLRQRIQGKR